MKLTKNADFRVFYGSRLLKKSVKLHEIYWNDGEKYVYSLADDLKIERENITLFFAVVFFWMLNESSLSFISLNLHNT